MEPANKGKKKAGRPKGSKSPWKYTEDRVSEIAALMEQYCDRPFETGGKLTQFPSLAEFCTEHRIPKDILFRNSILCEYRKRIELKREMVIERMMFTGHAPAACIFALKQIGWKDRQALELAGANDGPLAIKLVTNTGLPDMHEDYND